MADVLLQKVRKNYNPALLKDTLRNINLDIKDGDFIVFGPETRGLPKKYVEDENARTIPRREGQRSLNLSNSVAIIVYEAVRPNGL